MTFNKLISVACVLVFFTSLTGCSKNEPASSTTDNKTPTLADATSPKEAEQAKVMALPQGNATTPAKDYHELSNDNDVMFTYYALSNMPVDYDKLLNAYSQDYRSTVDEFKKQDMQKAFKPKIDKEIMNAKSTKYIKMKWNEISLDKYDFQSKSFPQRQLNNDMTFGWDSDYRVRYTNGDNFKLFKVEDEAKARQIEEMRSKGQTLDLMIYAFAQDAELDNHSIKVQILKVVLQDKNGNELVTLN